MSNNKIFYLTKGFCEKLKKAYPFPDKELREEELKIPIREIITEIGEKFAMATATTAEVPLAEERVRPDIAVHIKKLICGYIELKAPNLGADPTKLKGDHNKIQWEKLKNLPNLIYTDGREWALYRNGKRIGNIIRFSGDPISEGEKAVKENEAERLKELFQDFLNWDPIVPHKPKQFAEFIAPLTRLFRAEVERALEDPKSNINSLAKEWKTFFLPEADNAQFADNYAQTVVYALLLARFAGATDLTPVNAAKTLDKNNGILARSLEILGHPDALKELTVGFDILKRVMEALDSSKLQAESHDIWLYFYEDFLAAYDPKLRKNAGVYYTPHQVVEFQVRLAYELLEDKFGKKGFADEGVVFLDPAVGTGTYPVAVVKHGLDKVRKDEGEANVAARAKQMAKNIYGIEIMMGSYAVAHLRLTKTLEDEGAKLTDRLNIFLADTLESPNNSPVDLGFFFRALTEEHEAARKLKNEGDILVCLANPPYGRQEVEQGDTTTTPRGGWVRFGDANESGSKKKKPSVKAIFDDFLDPARKAGLGQGLRNIYNDYVYFWRWGLWRMFEKQKYGGIISFITASSYIAGPGFVGMRQVMRKTFDEIWIVDLGGSSQGTRKTPNVFAIQTPVAIAIGIRGKNSSNDTPAKVHYAKINGDTREEKLHILSGKKDFSSIKWQDCQSEWQDPFLPVGKGKYFEWPKLVDLFPYQRSGVVSGRTWPVGENDEVLKKRWESMLSEKNQNRKAKYKETRDGKITHTYEDHRTGEKLTPIAELYKKDKYQQIGECAYRSLDRQRIIVDNRVHDYIAHILWLSQSKKQIYLASLASTPLGFGPGIIASAAVPDKHTFRGSFGGKDIIPLYLDAEAKKPNITSGLIDKISTTIKQKITVEDFVSYVYAVLCNQSFTKKFWNELETPGAYIPITKDYSTFKQASKLGSYLIWLHTYAKRFNNNNGNKLPTGKVKYSKQISDNPSKYPEKYSYNKETKEIFVGDGCFSSVAHEVWEFEISGMKVVKSWLDYRMKNSKGKKTSPLDYIRPDEWTATMSLEFLELLRVVEATINMEPKLSKLLDKITSGDCFNAKELPIPTVEEKEGPKFSITDGKQKKLI